MLTFEGFADAVLIEELAIPQFPRAHGVLEVLIDTFSEGIDFWFLAKGGIFDDFLECFTLALPFFRRYMRLSCVAWFCPKDQEENCGAETIIIWNPA